MSNVSRELTHDEMKQEFLNYIHALVDYWEHEDRATTVKDKLDGLAFSMKKKSRVPRLTPSLSRG